jgi:5-phospho-D-xylono-1,4-lactonase
VIAPFVRTVLADIPPEDLGVCYAHEHIIIDQSYVTQQWPDFLLDSVELAAEELRQFHDAGGRAMVDSMPCAAGRNVLKLAEVSRRSSVHILCPTGLHLAKYYPDGHWGRRTSAAILAGLFEQDITLGIDANDYSGPDVQRTSHRAGLIKIASSLNRIDDFETKVFEAAAEAHRRTGAPILTHTEQGTAALEQVDLLDRLGVDLRHVVLSHTDRRADVGYHREILASGVMVEYDSAFRWKSHQANATLDLLVELAGEGYVGQLMLGMDAARRGYWRSCGGTPGLDFLLTTFREQLHERGFLASDWQQVFVANPARAYRFASPGAIVSV